MSTLKASHLVTVFFFVTTFSYTQPSRFGFGGGIIYGDEIEEIGGNFRAYYNMENGKICFGPEYTFFRMNGFFEGSDKISVDLYEFNFNAHYLIRFHERAAFYPVMGFNYSVEKLENKNTGFEETERAAGFNLGSGIHVEISHRLIGYVEFDRLFSELGENSYTAGILINVGLRSKEETEED